jgi:6-phosphogluconolactonase
MTEFKIYPGVEAVAQAAADYIYQQVQACVAEKGICHVVLPGGGTPARCLELLAEKNLPWENIHWYPGDERCYPVGHADRNDTMMLDKLFSPHSLSIPEDASKNFHAMPAELGPEKGSATYALLLDDLLPDALLPDAAGGIDIVVLGMGEDGHTASLFPGNAALKNPSSVVPVYSAPKAPDERISMGLNTLKNAGECIIIATGKNKRDALIKLKQGEILPVGMVEPDVWFVDEDAAG